MAEHIDMPAEEYHAHPAISAGKVEDFLESRRLFEGRYVTKTIPPKVPTPAMLLGTYIHLRILEPDRFNESLAEPYPETAPDGKNWLRRKGSDHEKWWADEVAKRVGKLALEQHEIDYINAIAESVLSKRWAAQLLRGQGEAEYSIFWTDAETGLELRCLVDWFSSIPIDIKSTGNASPSEFAKTCVRMGYHRKRQHYLAGIEAITNEPPLMVHIAVSTEPPFAAGAYDIQDIDRDGRSLGKRQWRRALKQIAECFESGDWSDPWEHEVFSLGLPAFAFSEDQYQL